MLASVILCQDVSGNVEGNEWLRLRNYHIRWILRGWLRTVPSIQHSLVWWRALACKNNMFKKKARTLWGRCAVVERWMFVGSWAVSWLTRWGIWLTSVMFEWIRRSRSQSLCTGRRISISLILLLTHSKVISWRIAQSVLHITYISSCSADQY